MSTQAVLHWEWQQTAFPYLLCYRLLWLHQGTLRFALGQMEKADLAGFLLMCSRMSCSSYHWAIIQISLWQPWKPFLLLFVYLASYTYTFAQKFHLNIRTTSLCKWLKLPWESVKSPSLEIFIWTQFCAMWSEITLLGWAGWTRWPTVVLSNLIHTVTLWSPR